MATKLIKPTRTLRITRRVEASLALLLALQARGSLLPSAVAGGIAELAFWRHEPADWTSVGQHLLARGQLIESDGRLQLTAQGEARLHDLCVLAYAHRDPFRHLTTAGFLRAKKVWQAYKGAGKRPFTNRRARQRDGDRKRGKYHVYAVLLKTAVMAEYPQLKRINPNRQPQFPCIYVGYTRHTPSERLLAHKHGQAASGMVMGYGVCLVPDLFAHLNPIGRKQQALSAEKTLAKHLRKQGYTVAAGHHDWVMRNGRLFPRTSNRDGRD